MKRISSFSVILVFVVLMVIGAGMIPLLNIQYSPTQTKRSVKINYSWSGASAKLIEMEVTSKIEGLVSSVRGVENISSVSTKGYGTVTVEFKNKKNIEARRFEIASLIRQIYKSLPNCVSYPAIASSSSGSEVSPILSFTVNANLPTQQIEKYINDNILKELAIIEGVNTVNLYGATPYYKEVSFDPQSLLSYNITIHDLESAITSTLDEYAVIGTVNDIGLMLKNDVDMNNIESVPVKKINGRIIRIGDIATVEYKEQIPTKYYRINGLNTINITIYPEKYINTLVLCSAVKDKMGQLSKHFPEKFSVITSYDSSITLNKELNKVIWRTALSLVILLLFVLLVSRSFKYTSIITLALLANIFIAFILYVIFDLEIHLYSLAGITVSLGILIDTAIIMTAHYSYYKNRKVFIAILAAQLTTIGALVVVFLLPEEQRANLSDFSGVIIINLAISLLIASLLIPALIDSVGIQEKNKISNFRDKRKIITFNHLYGKYISYGKKYVWVTFIVLILGFGIPIGKLPDKLDFKKDRDSSLVILYNKTIGSEFFIKKIKPGANMILGGSLSLFLKSSHSYYRDVSRPTLNIIASLPDGCTVAQLNEIVLSMENYLSQFKEIEIFKTDITGYNNARIEITFNKEIENSSFPLQLKGMIVNKAIDFGGANWRIYGLDDNSFNNNVIGGYKPYSIKIVGYNYDNLYAYCTECVKNLSKNKRIQVPEVIGDPRYGAALSKEEYYIGFDNYKLSLNNLSAADAYTALKEQLYSQRIGKYYDNGFSTDINMISANQNNFDVWNLKNEYITIGDKMLRFSDIGTIDKRNSGNDIYKDNQQYALYVGYDFIGTHEQEERIQNKEIDRLNNSVLPVGYKASSNSQWTYSMGNNGNNILLLLLIIAIIYFICTILFESLLMPLIIIGLIPVSFIGVFLIFTITGCSFDQGGFASLIMLAGIVVNAGIYILNEYRIQSVVKEYKGIKLYIRAFNHKIIPILLTVLSTALGLIPFLIDGEDEVFWFSFALGTIGGLLFSLIALVLFIPLWIPKHQLNN